MSSRQADGLGEISSTVVSTMWLDVGNPGEIWFQICAEVLIEKRLFRASILITGRARHQS